MAPAKTDLKMAIHERNGNIYGEIKFDNMADDVTT